MGAARSGTKQERRPRGLQLRLPSGLESNCGSRSRITLSGTSGPGAVAARSAPQRFTVFRKTSSGSMNSVTVCHTDSSVTICRSRKASSKGREVSQSMPSCREASKLPTHREGGACGCGMISSSGPSGRNAPQVC